MMIDTELFIMVVEKYPCLWDMSSNSYSNYLQKQKCWESIAEELNPEHSEKNDEEKQEFIYNIKKKWKNIRDSFRKEFNLQKVEKTSSTTKVRKPYKYFNHLSFLIPSTTSKSTESNVTDSEKEPCTDDDVSHLAKFKIVDVEKIRANWGQSFKPKPNRITKVNTKLQNIFIKQKLFENLQKNIKLKQRETETVDEDKMFLLSLLTDFKRIPEHLKLRFKAEFLNDFSQLVERYTQYGNQPISFTSNATSPSYASSG